MTLVRFFLLCLFLTIHAPSFAADRIGIAATVDDAIITNVDLQDRLKLVAYLSPIPEDPAVRKRFARQLLARMIDEKIQASMLEQEHLNVTLQEIHFAMEQYAKNKNISVNQLSADLKERGVDVSVLHDHIRAEIGWTKYLIQRLKPRTTIRREEIDEAMEALTGPRGFQEWHIREMVLPITSPKEEENSRELANDMLKALEEGTAFSELAEAFPNIEGRPTELHWVHADGTEPDILEALKTAEPGAFIGPIRTTSGYHIIWMKETRIRIKADESETEVALKQAILPVKDDQQNSLARRKKEAERLRASIKGCKDFDSQANLVPGAIVTELGRVQLRALHAEVRKIVEYLSVGEVSEPFKTPKGIHLMTVCERINATTTLVDPSKIKDMLTQRRIGLEALKLMRRWRREAYIDIKS